MKITKIFGFVLFLHIGLIAVFVLQPGCQTTQPPTRSGAVDDFGGQARVTASQPSAPFFSERSDLVDPVIVADTVETGRSTPRRPADDFGSSSGFNQDFSAAFNPVESEDEAPSIPVSEPSFTTHTVQSGDSLWAISRRYSVSLNEVLAVNDLNRDAVLRVGQQIRIPSEGSEVRPTARQVDTAQQSSGFEGSTTEYTVVRGDTLSGIASRHGTSVSAIKAANSKSSDVIRVGEVLAIPGTASASASTPQPTATPPQSQRTERPAATPSTSSGETEFYTVQQGDFPATIARRFGMTSSELLALNGITDPRRLQVGQRLRVRSGGEGASAQESTAETSQARSGTPSRPSSPAPVSIRTVEADPLPDGAFDDLDSEDSQTETIEDEDALFEDAVEIPVIRVED